MSSPIKEIYKQVFPEKTRLHNRLRWNKATSLLYRGEGFRCNLCNRSFRKMKPKGNWTIRENAECPYCGSLERTRVLLFYLQNETDFFSSRKKSLLHIAPEWGLIPLFKKVESLEYISGDINPNYADEQIDITDIPYPEDRFDYIFCNHVLGHIPDENKAITELRRVLKPDGVALIQTIIDWNRAETYESEEVKTDEAKLLHYSEPDLVRLHGADFSKRLEAGGFRVEVIDYRKSLGEERQREYSLGNGDREFIFKCTKQ